MMSFALFTWASALCGYAMAGEFVQHPPSDGDMAIPAQDKHAFTLDSQKVAVARRLQGGYAQSGNQGSYQNGGNYGYGQAGYGQGGYGQGGSHGGSKLDDFLPALSLLLPICLLLCLGLVVCQVLRCLCGGLCGDQADPMLGAGLGGLAGYETGMGALPGAVAGYEMGRYMDGQGVDSAALGGLAGYEMGQYMGGPGGYGGKPMY